MAFCQNCGKELTSGAKFCTECGAPVSQQGQGSVPENTVPTNPPTGPSCGQPQGQQPPCAYSGQPQNQQNPYSYGSRTPQVNAGEPGFTFEKGARKSKKPVIAIAIIGIIALVAVLAVITVMVSGFLGGNAEVLGRYPAVRCTIYGVDTGVEDEWIELKKGGRAEIRILGDTYTGKWNLDGSALTITQNGDEFLGTLEDGVITISFETLDYIFSQKPMTFATEPPATAEIADPTTQPPAPAEAAGTSIAAQWWSGDWYGWWVIQNGQGDYADLNDSFYDTCARILIYDDGSGVIELWDEDCAEGEIFATATITLDDDIFDEGVMCSTRGQFYDSEIGQYDWWVYPNEGLCVDNAICIQGHYSTDAAPDNTFDYSIYLRPWGVRWDDIPDDPSLPYDDMLPRNYTDWYLPLLEQGVTSAPDTIG